MTHLPRIKLLENVTVDGSPRDLIFQDDAVATTESLNEISNFRLKLTVKGYLMHMNFGQRKLDGS